MLSTLSQAYASDGAHTGANGAQESLQHQLEQARLDTRMHEERLQMLLQTSGDGLWDWNLRTDELYLSERWFKIVGIATDISVGNVSSLWLSLIHPDDLDSVMRQIYAHLRGETPRFECEYRVLSPATQEVRWVHSRGIARRDERGQPQRMVGSHRDIGERKRAEDRIRESQEIIRRNEERFRAMIENGSDLITLIDSAGVITYQSPSISRILGYAPEELIGTEVYAYLHPDDKLSVVDRATQAVTSDQAVFTAQVRALHKDGGYRWLEVNASARPNQIFDNEVILNSRDISDRVEARMMLEREVARRTRELQTLLTINRTVSSTLDLSSLLETILDTANGVVEYDSVALYELDDQAGTLRPLKYRGEHSDNQMPLHQAFDLAVLDEKVIETRRPVIIRDLEDDTRGAQDARSLYVQRFGEPRGVRSWMCLPLIARDRVLGIMSFDSLQPNYFSDAHAHLALAFAGQAAAAIENARLYAAEQMRLKVAESMREQVRQLNADLSRHEVFSRVLHQVSGAMMADAAAIFELDKESNLLEIRHSHGLPQGVTQRFSVPVGAWLIGHAVQEQRVHVEELETVIEHGAANGLSPERISLAHDLRYGEGFLWLMALPLVSDRQVYGGIVLYYRSPRPLGAEHMSLAATVGYQSALGIENTRLREDAAKNAIANERYRIARDLHDSVSQALYGISLGARTAKQIVANESPRATDAVDYVLALAEGGLAEMRALILELRPESLSTEGLVVVLNKQLLALCVRHKLSLEIKLPENEPQMRIEHKEALYRISMEAMQNIIKHAGATQVSVEMAVTQVEGARGSVEITLRDNGRGFDLTQNFPGHMGLLNMRERAESAGGCLNITSAKDAGTSVRVVMPLGAPAE